MNKLINITLGIITVLVIYVSPFLFLPYARPNLSLLKPFKLFYLSGLLFAVAVYFFFEKGPRLLVWLGRVLLILFLSLYFLFFAAAYGGQITYSSFGLTVYRFIPIPYFDIKIMAEGSGLSLRTKSHLIRNEEIENVCGSDFDPVIVGIGWSSVAKMEEGYEKLGIKVIVLPTPQAIDLFNKSVRERKRVGLILHTTC